MKRDRVFIKLSEVPEEGRSYSYDRESGEFDDVLRDLIEDNPYAIEFFIRPAGNVYELTGEIKTSLTRLCSQCGYDLEIPVKTKVHEFLLPKPEEAKGDTQSKRGFLPKESDEEETLSVTYTSGDVLNAEDMIHEIVGLTDPPYPSCEKKKCENYDEIQKKMIELQREAESALHGKTTAFDALKSLKF